MRVRLRISGDASDTAFVLGSLAERLPKGVVFHHVSGGNEALVEVEPLELLKAMLHERLVQIDPRRCTSMDWRAEREDMTWEAPRIDDIEDPMPFTVTVNGDSDRLDRLFPAAADHWPGGVLFRDGGSDDFGNYQMRVDVLPRWLVERAVADAIRAFDPALALEIGRVAASLNESAWSPGTSASVPTGAIEVPPEVMHGELPPGPHVIDGIWVVLGATEAGQWMAEHPSTGLFASHESQTEAIAEVVAEVKRRHHATG